MILLGTEWYQKNLVSSPITQFIKYFKLVLSLLGRFFLIFFNSFSNYFFAWNLEVKYTKNIYIKFCIEAIGHPGSAEMPKFFFLFSIKGTICCFILFAVVTLFGHHRSESGSSDLTKIRRFLQCNGIPRSAAGSCWRDSQWDQTFKVQFKFYFELIFVSPVWSRAFLLKNFRQKSCMRAGWDSRDVCGKKIRLENKGQKSFDKMLIGLVMSWSGWTGK